MCTFQQHWMLETIFVLVFNKGPDLLNRLSLLVQLFRVTRDSNTYTSVTAYGVNMHRPVGIDVPDEAVQVAGMASARTAAVAGYVTHHLWVPGSKLVSFAHLRQCFSHFLGKVQVALLPSVPGAPRPGHAQGDGS
jgi:hypothetical protein